jgi:hypothetical protein
MKTKNEAKGGSLSLSDLTTAADIARVLLVTGGDINHILSRLKNHYHPRKKKKNGKIRTLNVPSESLMLLQRKIVRHILSIIPLPECVHGGVQEKSTKKMAALHVGQRVVFKMDLDSFFPSVKPWMVKAVLMQKGIGEQAAAVLTALTTFGNELPQGAPTSTALANLILGKMDARLSTVCHQHGFAYSRWVDDLIFSGSMRLLTFRVLFNRIVEDEGFRAKPAKVKTMLRHERQEIVGLVVNTKVNLPREKRNEIRSDVITALKTKDDVDNKLEGKARWYKSVNENRGACLVRKIEQNRKGA